MSDARPSELRRGRVLENLGIAVHAVEIEDQDRGDTAVVIGCGPIGIMAAQTLEAIGVNVVMTDLARPPGDRGRGERGTVVNVEQDDPVAVVKG